MYDLIMIGAGPAGMSAAIYAARCKLSTLLISEAIGGHAAEAHKVENYPGFKSISGMELMEKFREHVESLGIEIKEETMTDIKKEMIEYLTVKEQRAETIDYSLQDDSMDVRTAYWELYENENPEKAYEYMNNFDSDLAKAIKEQYINPGRPSRKPSLKIYIYINRKNGRKGSLYEICLKTFLRR